MAADVFFTRRSLPYDASGKNPGIIAPEQTRGSPQAASPVAAVVKGNYGR